MEGACGAERVSRTNVREGGVTLVPFQPEDPPRGCENIELPPRDGGGVW